MTTSVRILTVSTWDSSPSVLLVSPSGNKTLVNCGEGCQRSFLESTGLRIRSVTRVCLTHIAHNAVGGLPGMVLTTADAAEAGLIAAAVSAKKSKSDSEAGESEHEGHKSKRKVSTPLKGDIVEKLPGLHVCGPRGTRQFLHSLRHFMRRDRFQLHIHEEEFCLQLPGPARQERGKKRGRKNEAATEGFEIQSIPLVHRRRTTEKSGMDENMQVMSYIFTTPPIPGKFLPDKARELGIPPGPLYSQLKSGNTVTFVDKGNKEVTVYSHEVVTETTPGVAVAVIYCPSCAVLKQLQRSEMLNAHCGLRDRENGNAPVLEVMIHMVAGDVQESADYTTWCKRFPQNVKHVLMPCPVDLGECAPEDLYSSASPFVSASVGAMKRSLVQESLFPSPITARDEIARKQALALHEFRKLGWEPYISNQNDNTEKNFLFASPAMEYIVIPRARKGFCSSDVVDSTVKDDHEEAIETVRHSGALDFSRQILARNAENRSSNDSMDQGQLLLTGTGSAIPCKHRNVTGMYVEMSNGKSIMLDVGEGTTGQLLLVKKEQHAGHDQIRCIQELFRNIKAIWISHPHADHHLGLLRLLTERKAACGAGNEPLVLIAPPNLFRFLEEYCHVDPRISGSYLPLDCRELMSEKQSQRSTLLDKLYVDLGISRCVAIPVAHCPHSYAVVMDGTPFGRLAYSGDCRPSTSFAEAGKDADLLIHEATFEDGMEQEAVVKRHCTVGEALNVSRRMKAKAVVLTHFSQRYPRIPPISIENNGDSMHVTESIPVVFGFDLMVLTPANIRVAALLTPALRLLYPEVTPEAPEDQDNDGPSASQILSIPGAFAQTGIL